MEKVMFYIAKDGTKFKDENSCLLYEKSLSYEENHSKYYGFKFEHEVDFFNAMSEIPSFCPVEDYKDIENANAIYTDEKGVEELSDIIYTGGLKANSICVYDYRERWWYRLEDIIKMYEVRLSELNKLMSDIGKLIKI